MRKLMFSLAAATALVAGATLVGPASAAPSNGLGSISSAAEMLGDVELAAIVCGRWRCWRTWGYRPYGFYRPWRRRYWW
jgi:hypothetical protein